MSTLRRSLSVVAILVGLVWTGQGLGWIGGSFMTGETLWALIGPVVAMLGVVSLWDGRKR